MTRKILLIEDNDVTRRLIEFILTDAGFKVESAPRSDKAIELAREKHPDLIMMDVMMQPLNGCEVCKALKNDAQTKDIPVVLVSAKGQKKEQEEGLEAGATAYLVKPFEPEELLATLQALLDKKAI